MENRTVIHEEKEAILRTFQNEEANISLLNDIHRIKPFNDFQTVLSWSKDKAFIQTEFFKENPEAQKLSQFTKSEFIFPSHLVNLKRLLQSINNQTGLYAKFDSKKKSWALDIEALEAYNDRYRKFATSPEELTRWEFAKKYVDYVNQLNPGTQSRKIFAQNDMAVIVATPEGYKLSPDWRFVFKEFRY